LAMAVALALPAWSQHQGGHGGGSGHIGGGSGHFGGMGHGRPTGSGRFAGQMRAPNYSGLYGIQSPSSFSPPGRFPMPGRLEPPVRAGSPLLSHEYGYSRGAYSHRPGYPGRNPHRGHYRRHDHDRRYRSGWGRYAYVPGYVYPYAVDPDFYDWGATDYSQDEQGAGGNVPPDQGPEYGYGSEAPNPRYEDVPYSQQPENTQPGSTSAPTAPQRQEYHFTASSPTPLSSKPLTVIFKGNRAPEKIQNYMVNSSSLTNLDSEHFEEIPLEQIDIAATQQANRTSGIDFQVPAPSHD
jgi:hypothetical protein